MSGKQYRHQAPVIVDRTIRDEAGRAVVFRLQISDTGLTIWPLQSGDAPVAEISFADLYAAALLKNSAGAKQ